jgi:hypothetical protein
MWSTNTRTFGDSTIVFQPGVAYQFGAIDCVDGADPKYTPAYWQITDVLIRYVVNSSAAIVLGTASEADDILPAARTGIADRRLPGNQIERAPDLAVCRRGARRWRGERRRDHREQHVCLPG